MRFYFTAFYSLVLTLSLPCFAFAQSPQIFFNGIDVTGMQGQTFKNVDVRFDNTGNLQITAAQYSIKETTKKPTMPTKTARQHAHTTPTSPTTSPIDAAALEALSSVASQTPEIPSLPEPSQATHLVALFDSPGLFGFNIDLYVNGQFIKSLDQGLAQHSVDISSHLVKGKNKIQYRLIAAADSGKSSRALLELFLAKESASQGNTIELIGNYAPLIIKSGDAKTLYDIEVLLP